MTVRLHRQTLPEGWVWTSLGDITDSIQYGHTESASTQNIGPKFLRITDIQDGQVDWSSVPYCKCSDVEHEKYQLAPGDIVFARTGATTGKSYLIQSCPDAVFASYLIRLRVANVVYSKYLSTFFESSSYWSQITQVKKGSAQPGVNASILSTIRLPLAPLNEQHRIVEAIETQFTRLDAAVTALKRSQANLKRYRAAVLKAACEGRLVPTEAELVQAEGRSYEPATVLLERILTERRCQWEAENPKKKYQEPVAPDTSALPELPEGWCWASLDQLVSKIEAGKSPKAENRPAKPDELGVLKVSAVSWGEFQPEENKTLFHTSLSVENLSVKAGDVLISRANTVELVGAVVLVRHDYPNLLLSDKTLRLVFVSDELLRFYIIQALRTPWVRRVYEELATGTSDSMRNLSQDKILSAPIPLPPFAEQQRIVAELERRFSLITQLEKTIETDLARANRLRQSILKRAFAGQLVPQDPHDEPASVLLERMKAAKDGKSVQPPLSTVKE